MNIPSSRVVYILGSCLLAILLCASCTKTATNSTTNNLSSSASNNKGPTTGPVASASAAPANLTASGLHTPPDDSSERKAILEAVASELKRKDDFDNARFDVESLKVHDGWAYIVTDVDDPQGTPYGLVEALLQETNGQWNVSEVFDSPGGGAREEREARAKLRSNHAGAPEDIFPAR